MGLPQAPITVLHESLYCRMTRMVWGELAAMISITNFAHMRPNCVTGSSPRGRSFAVALRLYRFFQCTYSASGTP